MDEQAANIFNKIFIFYNFFFFSFSPFFPFPDWLTYSEISSRFLTFFEECYEQVEAAEFSTRQVKWSQAQ